ncbi:MAG: amidase [Solirubrobacteraceae bacterium]|nr:amidase [Solirubrobacteraceae bacterium]
MDTHPPDSPALAAGEDPTPGVGVDRRRFLAGAAAVAAGATATGAFLSQAQAEAALPDAKKVAAKGGNPADLEMHEAIALLWSRRLSSRELTKACLERIEERDGELTAWARVYADEAMAAAAAADRRLSLGTVLRYGPPSLVCGIPIGFKDIIAVGGKPLTAGSLALADNVAPSDSFAWERAKLHGMVLLGHTKTQEFASGNSPQTAGNPFDPTKSPGGSSNGSGSAVGGRTVPVALGTDSGGSLRRPASACNLTTIMGTYGRVSTRGIVTGNRASDHVGPLVRSAIDASLMFTVLAGRDPLDITTYAAPPPPTLYPVKPTGGAKPFRGMTFATTPNLPPIDTLAPGVRAVWERFLGEVVAMGATIVEKEMPPAPSVPGPSPESVLLHRDLFAAKGDLYSTANRTSVANNQANANNVTAIARYEAEIRRGQWVAGLQELFAGCDAIIQPCQVAETPKRGDGSLNESGDLGRFGPGTVRGIWNSTGFPSLSVPAGLSPETSMPVGAQISGLPWTDGKLLQIAINYQHNTDYHELQPERYAA